MNVEILAIDQHESGDLYVTAKLPAKALRGDDVPEDQLIVIPVAALANRRMAYGLATNEEALDAILKEHAQRLNKLPEHPHDNPRIAKMGGHRPDVTVKRNKAKVSPAAAAVLAGG